AVMFAIYQDPSGILYYNSFTNPEFSPIGDYHFERVGNNEKHWATISSVTLIDDETIRIVFHRNNYRIGNETVNQYEIPNEFEYTHLVKKGQTFISVCMGKSNPAFLKYMGIVQTSGNYYYEFYHTDADLPQGLICKYPEIIQHGFDANFDITGSISSYKRILLNGTLYTNSMITDVANPCGILDCNSPYDPSFPN
ncbi:MAG: hypothetical protein HZA84_08650, partial [Thaumarchaeota archaeon]|nr:hypothetical protein [Nitrososphaerota archaeon]